MAHHRRTCLLLWKRWSLMCSRNCSVIIHLRKAMSWRYEHRQVRAGVRAPEKLQELLRKWVSVQLLLRIKLKRRSFSSVPTPPPPQVKGGRTFHRSLSPSIVVASVQDLKPLRQFFVLCAPPHFSWSPLLLFSSGFQVKRYTSLRFQVSDIHPFGQNITSFSCLFTPQK